MKYGYFGATPTQSFNNNTGIFTSQSATELRKNNQYSVGSDWVFIQRSTSTGTTSFEFTNCHEDIFRTHVVVIKDIIPTNYNIKFSKLISFVWALIIAFSALIFTSTSGPLIEIALSISSITYGGMLGFFVLNFVKKNISIFFIVLSFIVSMLSMIYIVNFTSIAWPLFTLIGSLIMVIFAFTLNQLFSIK